MIMQVWGSIRVDKSLDKFVTCYGHGDARGKSPRWALTCPKEGFHHGFY